MGLVDADEFARWRAQAAATRDAAHPVLERRRREREDRLDRARRYAASIADRLPITAAVVFGSVARGDFNAWSDLDVLVIADDLPAGARARLELLHDRAFPGLQPVGWTPDEFLARAAQRDPIAVEAAGTGVVLRGRLPSSGTT